MGNKEVLGIIPARGGSQSIPRKNIKLFLGKPLIAWAIETLSKSGVLNRVVVSTDDEEIGAISRSYGAEVPFRRPAELADDTTPVWKVIQHALLRLKADEKYNPDYVVLFEPTSAGKRPLHVRGVVDTLLSTGADSVVSVAEVPPVLHPDWQIKLADNSKIKLFNGIPAKDVITRRQDLSKTYYRNSSIYAFKPKLLFSEKPNFYGEDVRAYITDSKYAFDIDTPEDWENAEIKFKKILEEEKLS